MSNENNIESPVIGVISKEVNPIDPESLFSPDTMHANTELRRAISERSKRLSIAAVTKMCQPGVTFDYYRNNAPAPSSEPDGATFKFEFDGADAWVTIPF